MTKWYASKTLWLNSIAVIAMVLQSRFGFIVDPEAQAALLALINMILRAITNQPLDWKPANPTNGDGDGPHLMPPSTAGFINLRCLVELFLVGASLLILCAGCATVPPPGSGGAGGGQVSPQVLAGKSLLAVKSTIVMAASSVDALCKAQKLTADKCAQARSAYDRAKVGYDMSVDTYLLMMQGGDPAVFANSLQRTQALASDLLGMTGGAQ